MNFEVGVAIEEKVQPCFFSYLGFLHSIMFPNVNSNKGMQANVMLDWVENSEAINSKSSMLSQLINFPFCYPDVIPISTSPVWVMKVIRNTA